MEKLSSREIVGRFIATRNDNLTRHFRRYCPAFARFRTSTIIERGHLLHRPARRNGRPRAVHYRTAPSSHSPTDSVFLARQIISSSEFAFTLDSHRHVPRASTDASSASDTNIAARFHQRHDKSRLERFAPRTNRSTSHRRYRFPSTARSAPRHISHICHILVTLHDYSDERRTEYLDRLDEKLGESNSRVGSARRVGRGYQACPTVWFGRKGSLGQYYVATARIETDLEYGFRLDCFDGCRFFMHCRSSSRSSLISRSMPSSPSTSRLQKSSPSSRSRSQESSL